MRIFLSIALMIWLLPLNARADVRQQMAAYVESRLAGDTLQDKEKSGFRYQMALFEYWDQLSPQTQTLARDAWLVSEPPREDSVLSPSGHFMLHFDRSGRHAVPAEDVSENGIPDYIDSAAVILDYVWQIEIDSLGFQAPPDQNGQPVSLYHIYFTSMSYYGLTTFSWDDISALPGLNYTSYIELHNNYAEGFYTRGLDALKVTAAHEFNHAIQLGYNFRFNDDLYFMEMTSTFMEDYVYDEVNDYVQYLDRFFSELVDLPFDADWSFHPYANGIFLKMLSRQLGAGIVPWIWEGVKTNKSLAAIDSILNLNGTTFADVHNTYATWLYFTGDRALPGKFFLDAADYPQIELLNGRVELTKPLNRYRMRHVKIDTKQPRVYEAIITGEIKNARYNHITGTLLRNPPSMLNQSQFFFSGDNEPLIALMTNTTDSVLMDIEYNIIERKVAPDKKPIVVRTSSDKIIFEDVPPYGKIIILTINGRYLIELKNQINDLADIEWNMRDRFNHPLASGVYIYFAKAGDLEMKGKFAVVRKK